MAQKLAVIVMDAETAERLIAAARENMELAHFFAADNGREWVVHKDRWDSLADSYATGDIIARTVRAISRSASSYYTPADAAAALPPAPTEQAFAASASVRFPIGSRVLVDGRIVRLVENWQKSPGEPATYKIEGIIPWMNEDRLEPAP